MKGQCSIWGRRISKCVQWGISWLCNGEIIWLHKCATCIWCRWSVFSSVCVVLWAVGVVSSLQCWTFPACQAKITIIHFKLFCFCSFTIRRSGQFILFRRLISCFHQSFSLLLIEISRNKIVTSSKLNGLYLSFDLFYLWALKDWDTFGTFCSMTIKSPLTVSIHIWEKMCPVTMDAWLIKDRRIWMCLTCFVGLIACQMIHYPDFCFWQSFVLPFMYTNLPHYHRSIQ